MEHANAALAAKGDREPGLGDGVHGRRDNRDAELDRPRQPRAGRDVVWQHTRLGRHEQHVVECEAFLGELPVQGDEPLQLVLAESGLPVTERSKKKELLDSAYNQLRAAGTRARVDFLDRKSVV